MNIPEPFTILDLRPPGDFKGVTICGFKKTEVSTVFQNSIINGKLEESLKWCVEMHSSGMNKNIFDSLFSIFYKYIHVHHPKLYLYFIKRFKEYNKLLKNYPNKKHEVFTRNDQEIRHLFSELTTLATLSKKTNLFLPKSLPKIDKNFYSKEDIGRRMIAKNTDSIYNFVPIQADSDIIFALNEIYTSLSTSKATYENCIYWHLWLEKVESMKKKDNIEIKKLEKEDLKPIDGVEDIYWGLWVWFLWDIILKFAKKLEDQQKIFLIQKMYEDFKYEFKPLVINRKKYLFFSCYYLIKKKINFHKPLIEKEEEYLLIQSCANINRMYREVKSYNENNLSYEDKSKLYSEYTSLYMKLDEMKKQEKELVEKKKLRDIHQVKDTFITQIDPTKYPDLKPLSRKAIQKDEINIEYQNIIEDQARILENQYEKEIISGLKSRMKDTSNVKSMVERIRRRKEDETVDEEEEEKENMKEKKMQLFKSFVAFKNEDSEQRVRDKHKDKEDKWKTIEILDRSERKKQYNQQFFGNNNDENNNEHNHKHHHKHTHKKHKHHKKDKYDIHKNNNNKEFLFNEGFENKEKNKYKDWDYSGIEDSQFLEEGMNYDNIEYVDNSD